MSRSHFTSPPHPKRKSSASSFESLAVESDFDSDDLSDTFPDYVGTNAGYTDLNTTVVSDAKPTTLPTLRTEADNERNGTVERLVPPPSPFEHRGESSAGIRSSSRGTRSRTRSTASRSTPRQTRAAFIEEGELFPLEDPDALTPARESLRHRPLPVRKRRHSSPGLRKHAARSTVLLPSQRPRKVSRSHRRMSGEPRMVQFTLSRDFFLIIGLCVVLACAMIVLTRPAAILTVHRSDSRSRFA